MSKINILDKTIYNRIAAGEVVEKPASVVKEMVENSIDAGATNIVVEVVNGGIDKIRVTDNGCGISYEDLPKVFMSHATSKISCIDDLDKIGTLGFRGEALSSIASVSRVTLITKTSDSDEGYKLTLEGGDNQTIEPYGCNDGTTIIMENLFFNVPARAKFLRRPKQEEADITNYISRLIMANPNISIKYIADNKQVFISSGTGLFDAIYCVYGKSIVDNLIEINYSKDLYSFSGYIGKPTFTKPNRTYQTLVINGRYVINQTISTAIYKAFESYMMKGNFPFYVIHLNIPLDKVDVNVHPNKLDVKFEDSNRLFGIVYQAISEILFNCMTIKQLDDDKEEQPQINYNNLNILQSDEGKSFNVNESTTAKISEVEIPSATVYSKAVEINKLISAIDKPTTNTLSSASDSYSTKLAQKIVQQQTVVNEDNNTNTDSNLNLLNNNYRIVGVLFNTYIVVEQNDYIYVIDQHAAHERLLYDKFKANYEKQELTVQPLLIPYILEVNYIESNYIENNINVFTQLGFDIESFGTNCYKISAVPVMLKNINLKSFFDDILGNMTNKLIIDKSSAMQEYLAKSACRAAVKANDILSNSEISALLAQLSHDNQVLLCPHGRPIVVKITDKDIEKWFKRIV